MNENTLAAIYKLLRFGLVGLTGMIVDFATTWFVKESLKWNKYVANSCGFSLAVINNYIINRIWTFESKSAWLPEFGRFLLFSLIGLGINNILLYLFHEKGKMNFYASKALAIGCVFIWNFLSNLFLNFH